VADATGPRSSRARPGGRSPRRRRRASPARRRRCRAAGSMFQAVHRVPRGRRRWLHQRQVAAVAPEAAVDEDGDAAVAASGRSPNWDASGPVVRRDAMPRTAS
jgi:hypothetical protein